MDKPTSYDPLSLRERPGREDFTQLSSRARALRRQSSEAERTLWKYLRAHRLKGYKFRRQVIIEPYIVDFACLDAKLIIEADGGQHVEQMAYDERRTAYLQSIGYRVLRFWNHEIFHETQSVLERIESALNNFPSP